MASILRKKSNGFERLMNNRCLSLVPSSFSTRGILGALSRLVFRAFPILSILLFVINILLFHDWGCWGYQLVLGSQWIPHFGTCSTRKKWTISVSSFQWDRTRPQSNGHIHCQRWVLIRFTAAPHAPKSQWKLMMIHQGRLTLSHPSSSETTSHSWNIFKGSPNAKYSYLSFWMFLVLSLQRGLTTLGFDPTKQMLFQIPLCDLKFHPHPSPWMGLTAPFLRHFFPHSTPVLFYISRQLLPKSY